MLATFYFLEVKKREIIHKQLLSVCTLTCANGSLWTWSYVKALFTRLQNSYQMQIRLGLEECKLVMQVFHDPCGLECGT